jgi:hypothetical protein
MNLQQRRAERCFVCPECAAPREPSAVVTAVTEIFLKFSTIAGH